MKESYLSGPHRRFPLLAMGLLALAACAGEGGEVQGTPDAELPPGGQPMSETVQNLVNQGNEAHRQGLYQEALEYYQEAMSEAPGHPVPEFGALMASQALGNTDLADSLAARLAVTAPELVGMFNAGGPMGGMPGAPHGGMEGAMPGMPPGHPVIMEVTPDTVAPDTSGAR